jgi:hypothetical protein
MVLGETNSWASMKKRFAWAALLFIELFPDGQA